MIHLEASFNGKNHWWRYLIMLVAVMAAANTIGAIPLLFFYFKALVTDPGVAAELAANPTNLTFLGVGPVTGLTLMLIPFLVGILAYALLVKPLNGRSFMQTINGTQTFRWNRFLVAALLWLLISAFYLFAYIGIDPENFRLNNTSTTLISLVLVSVALIPFQAGMEELLFRGYLMQGFFKLVPRKWFPLIMTSVLFGLMHAFNPEIKEFGFLTMMPQYILFGLVFGVVTILDDGIETAMGAHAANNIFLSIMLTHKSSALQTPAVYEQIDIFPWMEFAGLLIMSFLFILILGRIFRWNPRVLV
jgi:membrane protease YdiL (CAAX protease family)